MASMPRKDESWAAAPCDCGLARLSIILTLVNPPCKTQLLLLYRLWKFFEWKGSFDGLVFEKLRKEKEFRTLPCNESGCVESQYEYALRVKGL
jgi:hypothetical protein